MYTGLLHTHSALRWVVIALCIYCVVRATAVDAKRGKFTDRDRKFFLGLTIAADAQLLIGLLLYFVASPITKAAMAAFGPAMKNRTLRYWAVEHAFTMIFAIVFIHAAKIFLNGANDDVKKRSRTRRAIVVALLLLLLGQPWPFLPYGRSLMP